MKRLRNPFRRKPHAIVIEPAEEMVAAPAPAVESTAVPIQPSAGKVVKVKGPPQYKAGSKRRRGGRVVRTMPAGLRKLRERAEDADL